MLTYLNNLPRKIETISIINKQRKKVLIKILRYFRVVLTFDYRNVVCLKLQIKFLKIFYFFGLFI